MKEALLSRWFAEAGEAIKASSASERRNDSFLTVVDLSRRLRKDRAFLEAPHDRYIAFITERFLRSVHGNLFMDTPYDEQLAEKRLCFLERIGECLTEAAKALARQDVPSAHESLQAAVNSYLQLIEESNLLYRARDSVKAGGDQ